MKPKTVSFRKYSWVISVSALIIIIFPLTFFFSLLLLWFRGFLIMRWIYDFMIIFINSSEIKIFGSIVSMQMCVEGWNY